MPESRCRVTAARTVAVAPVVRVAAAAMTWVESRIARRRDWAEGLISLTLDVAVAQFIPGQYVNLGIDLGGTRVKRSYSLASGPGEPTELYLSEVPGGALTPTLFALRQGDALWL